MVLRITTCQAENTHAPARVVADYIGNQLGITTEFVLNLSWPERKTGLLNGDIHLGWICGFWYAQQAAGPHSPLKLLAAPVFRGIRYRNRPVYFSHVVVRRESRIKRFTDLEGLTWVFNERNSLSGNHVMRWALAARGQNLSFFGQVKESGSHLLSMAMVARGQADVAAIDSTVWDDVQQNQPELCCRLRVIKILGPNPAPPWVISRRLPAGLSTQIRDMLLDMHNQPAGNALLKNSILERFVDANKHDYESLQIDIR